jgi:hypothetical protein
MLYLFVTIPDRSSVADKLPHNSETVESDHRCLGLWLGAAQLWHASDASQERYRPPTIRRACSGWFSRLQIMWHNLVFVYSKC